MTEKISFVTELIVAAGQKSAAPALLAAASGLSRLRIKDAMAKGAVWVQARGRKPQRLRRADQQLAAGTRLLLYYDSSVLTRDPPKARLLQDEGRYSVWFKPAGLLVEGSRYGDHATLLRQVETGFSRPRRVWLVHRLDLEAAGLILIAHTPQAAARLSALFQDRRLDKEYLIELRGHLGAPGHRGCWEAPLDGKAAHTAYEVLAVSSTPVMSRVRIRMRSGRHHQIRRHAAGAGFPVLGDPRYGRENAHPAGLRLVATRLAFHDPWRGVEISFTCEAEIHHAWGWTSEAAETAREAKTGQHAATGGACV